MFSNIFSKSKTKSTKYIFNTNVKCSGCVEKIKLQFEKNAKIHEWSVDVQSTEKPLTIQTELNPKEVQKLVEKAGFTADLVSQDTI